AVSARVPGRRLIRRLLGRLLVGHDLLVGDEVEVRSLEEIRATLDPGGELDALPFMPEMAKFCGTRARVFRCADKIYDYGRTKKMRRLERTVLLTDLRCDGAAHGGCQASCLVIWKTKWLRRIRAGEHRPDRVLPSGKSGLALRISALSGVPDGSLDPA